MKKKTLIVTGAGGFVGQRLVQKALDMGWAVRALVRRPETVCFPKHVDLCIIAWDMDQVPFRLDIFEGGDALCHLAAFIPPDHKDPKYADTCVRVNALGTLNLLSAVEAIGGMRFVQFSGNLYRPGQNLCTETDPLYPSFHSPYYLSSKLLADYYSSCAIQKGLPVTILRIASVYGIGMGPKGLIPSFSKRLRAGEAIEVQDGGRYEVDLVWVRDVVWAALQAADGGLSEVFNIGSGTTHTTLDVAQVLTEILNVPTSRINVFPPIRDVIPQGFSPMDITHAQKRLGYQPTTLKDGLLQYVQSLND